MVVKIWSSLSSISSIVGLGLVVGAEDGFTEDVLRGLDTILFLRLETPPLVEVEAIVAADSCSPPPSKFKKKILEHDGKEIDFVGQKDLTYREKDFNFLFEIHF